MQAGLTELAECMGTDPEKYRGHSIVVEQRPAGVIKESGILEDYSSKYLLVREVQIHRTGALEVFTEKSQVREHIRFGLRWSSSIIRHTTCDPI